MTATHLRPVIGDLLMAAILGAFSTAVVVAFWFGWRPITGAFIFCTMVWHLYGFAWTLRTDQPRPRYDLNAISRKLATGLTPFSTWVRAVPVLSVLATLYYLNVTTFGDGRPFQ